VPTLTVEDGVEIRYRVLGRGPNPLILLHGWMVSGAVFSSLLEVMDLHGLRLIVPDQRGSGASSKPEFDVRGPSSTAPTQGQPYALERYARDVMALVEAEELETFGLVGHSMGAQIAKLVAIEGRERVSGLVTLCGVPASGAPLPEEALPGFRAAAHDREARGALLDAVCKRLTQEDRERLLEDSDKVAPQCIAGAFESWFRGGFAEQLSRIEAPTLVVATDDPTLPVELLRESTVKPIPRARLVHLPGPGHYPHVEAPRETAALLQAFFAGLFV
jgi:non-heme chloroperoxidase